MIHCERYYIIKSNFHNGGILSSHKSAKLAEKRLTFFQGDCKCGCGHIFTGQEILDGKVPNFDPSEQRHYGSSSL